MLKASRVTAIRLPRPIERGNLHVSIPDYFIGRRMVNAYGFYMNRTAVVDAFDRLLRLKDVAHFSTTSMTTWTHTTAIEAVTSNH